jgi:uncharacterized membrane protein YbhN (UPF0104 family)
MTTDTARTRRRRAILGLKFAVVAALLAVVVRGNREAIREAFAGGLHAGRFAMALGCYAAGVLLAILRWFLLVRAVGLPFRPRDAMRLGFIGMFFNFVLPGAIGGDFVRAAALSREQGRTTRPIATVVVDRLAGLLGLFLLATLVGTLGWSSLAPPVRRLVTTAAIASAVTAAILGAAFLPGLGRDPAHHSAKRAELAAVGIAYRSRWWVLIVGVLMALVTHSLVVLGFYNASRAALPGVPGPAEHFLIVPLVLFSTAVPLPLGALGVSEQVSSGLFELAGFRGGAVAMLLFRVLQFAVAAFGGLVYLANATQVKELTATAEHLDERLIAEEARDEATRAGS